MAELVPDSWRFQDEEQNKCCHQNRRLRRGPVTDILLWIECYAPMVAVLSSGFTQKTPELMAYQKTIVRAYWSFSGDGWVTYDSCYRRKAAVTKSLDWGQVDFTLYNETFTGKAKPIAWCKFRLSEHHFSSGCAYAPQVTSHKPESVTSVRLHYDSGKPHTQICHLFNNKAGNICRFNPCRFGHVCIVCRGSHPASQCRSRPPPPKFHRSDSPAGKGRKWITTGIYSTPRIILSVGHYVTVDRLSLLLPFVIGFFLFFSSVNLCPLWRDHPSSTDVVYLVAGL